MRRLSISLAAVGVVGLGVAALGGIGAPGISWQFFAYLACAPAAFNAAGIFLLWKHPGLRAGELLSIAAVLTMAIPVGLEVVLHRAVAATGVQPWMGAVADVETLLLALGLVAFALFVAFFPSGRAPTPQARAWAWAFVALPALALLSVLALAESPRDEIAYGGIDPFPNPLSIAALAPLAAVAELVRPLMLLAIVVPIVVLGVRYRRAGDRDRLRIRWLGAATLAAVLLNGLPYALAPLLFGDSGGGHAIYLVISNLALVLIPAAAVIAIHRPEWFDVGTVVRKGLVYAALSLVIVLVYAALAAAIGLAAGSRLPVGAAVVAAVVVALLFNPARVALQRWVDRRLFGARPSQADAVAHLSKELGSSTGREFAERAAALIRQGGRFAWVEVDSTVGAARVGERRSDVALTAPIVVGSEEVGEIRCGPKVAGRMTEQDEALVGAVASQVAHFAATARLAGRLVHAQEGERRRIERNIHDGVQQELIALVAKVGLARRHAARGDDVASALDEIQADVRRVHQDLRELAQGIHPSVLSDGGLVAAVEDRCGRLGTPVAMEADRSVRALRFDDEVEGAAFFLVTEGIANALKHAGDARVTVRIAHEGDHLAVAVSDDGAGFAPADVTWSGLAGLRDRFSALAGTVTVSGAPGRGASLDGRLPAEPRVRV